jgi:hypothetical protein
MITPARGAKADTATTRPSRCPRRGANRVACERARVATRILDYPDRMLDDLGNGGGDPLLDYDFDDFWVDDSDGIRARSQLAELCREESDWGTL